MPILSCSSTLPFFRFQPSTTYSFYSFMLPAPKEVKLLPPPRLRIEIERVPQRPLTYAELVRQCGPIQSRDDMRAELAQIAHQTFERLCALAQTWGGERAA